MDAAHAAYPDDPDIAALDGLAIIEGVDLNAAGGIRDYFEKFGFIFDAMAKQNGHDGPVVTPDTIATLESYARSRLPLAELPQRTQWRDGAIVALRAIKAKGSGLTVEESPGL